MRLTALALLAALPFAAQAQTSPVTVTPLASTDVTAAGQPIAFPPPGSQVLAARYVIAPGARLPVHLHPHPRLAYVLAGTLVVTDAESGAETRYAPGDVVVEMIGRWHFGRNDGPDPVELLVIDLVPPGESNTVLRGD